LFFFLNAAFAMEIRNSINISVVAQSPCFVCVFGKRAEYDGGFDFGPTVLFQEFFFAAMKYGGLRPKYARFLSCQASILSVLR
jgi:hypothetical protein